MSGRRHCSQGGCAGQCPVSIEAPCYSDSHVSPSQGRLRYTCLPYSSFCSQRQRDTFSGTRPSDSSIIPGLQDTPFSPSAAVVLSRLKPSASAGLRTAENSFILGWTFSPLPCTFIFGRIQKRARMNAEDRLLGSQVFIH